MIISTDNDNFSITICLPGKDWPNHNINNVRVIGCNGHTNGSGIINSTVVKCGPLKQLEESAESSTVGVCNAKTVSVEEHEGSLLSGLNGLRVKGLLLDVTLWAQNVPFQAHRAVLAASSEYFRAMFTDPMKERLQTDIYLAGISASGLAVVLDYVYTSAVRLSVENVQAVLSAASHLQVIKVLDQCASFLMSQMDADNCVHILALADMYDLVQLKHRCYKFLAGSLSAVSEEQIMSLTVTQMGQLLSSDLAVDVSEAQVLELLLSWISSDQSIRAQPGHSLLKWVHFPHISRDELHRVLDRFSHLPESLLFQLREATEETTACGEENGFILKAAGLVNLRGMREAVIKVGGFGRKGVTNEISYTLFGSRQWRRLTSVPHIECCNFGCAVLDNEVYVVGGCFDQIHNVADLHEVAHPFGFKYNPRSDRWCSIAPMLRDRCRFSLTSVGRLLYAVGGSCGTSDSLVDDDVVDADGHRPIEDVKVEVYDPSLDVWSPVPGVPGDARTLHASVSWRGKFLFVSGGLDGDHNVLDTMLVYDVDNKCWEALGWRRLPMPRADHVMLSYKDKVYVVGGWSYGPRAERSRLLLANVDVYDVEADVWSVETRIPTPRFHAGFAILNQTLYVVGGCLSDVLFDRATSQVDCYDLDSRQWRRESRYPEELWEHLCLALYVPRGLSEDEDDS